jgi:hypothetical protein
MLSNLEFFVSLYLTSLEIFCQGLIKVTKELTSNGSLAQLRNASFWNGLYDAVLWAIFPNR